MNAFSNEIHKLAAELCSQKVNTRNKAAELLDQKLTHSKADLCELLESGGSASERLTWSLLFENAVEAAMKHADMLFESRDKKGFQTMVNKNYIYSSIIIKIVEYNLEAGCHYLAKNTIIKGFCTGIAEASAKDFFGLTILQLLDRGIYSAPTYVRDLKINEYSRILSYLFEVNVFGDNQLFSGILKTITRTIELAIEHVQIHSDLLAYLPNLLGFCKMANNDQRKANMVKLYGLFVNELSIDYRAAICLELQKLLPLICGFYDEMNMNSDTKVLFFRSVYISLITIYPSARLGDFGTMHVNLQEDWSKTIKMLKTIVDMEIRYYVTFRLTHPTFNCSEEFIKLAALVTYITDWHLQSSEQSRTTVLANENDSDDDGDGESANKMSRLSDAVEHIIELVQLKDSTFNEVWFAIFVELISEYRAVLNMSNFRQVLDITLNILRATRNANQMHCVRLGFTALLHNEARIFAMPPKSNEILSNLWSKVIDFLLSDTASIAELIEERELILQLLIANNKMTPNQCITLLQLIMANNLCKRNECIATIRELFIHAEQYRIDKASAELGRIISWAYKTSENVNVTNVIHNIAPINVAHLADTFAIAVINFLDKQNAPQSVCPAIATDRHNQEDASGDRLQLLMYKYNQKLICLAEFDKQFVEQRAAMALNSVNSSDASQGERNCLFQFNYELLMREVNYTITQGCQRNDILVDLKSLHNITCLMERFLHYQVFDGDSYRQCPLIKRIGLFLSHLEFQLKSNNPCDFDAVDLTEMLTQLELIFTIYTTNDILLRFIELEPLEELISFVAMVLSLSEKRQKQSEFNDWSPVTKICLRILTVLCGSSSHSRDAFGHIDKQHFKINEMDTLQMIAIFCSYSNVQLNIAAWLVDKLKNIFKFHHTNIEIIEKTVEQLPAIFGYIHKFDEQLEVMLIALNSLLKIAFKKSYPVELTVKILNSIALICERIRDIYVDNNFANICCSASKFFKFSSLKIQYATISMLIALMNSNLMSSNPVRGNETHISFCEKLYEYTDWQNYNNTSSVDEQQNSLSCVLQLLVSLFVFSSHQQEIALLDLVQFCAQRKLTEDNFYALQNTVQYYQLSIKELAHLQVKNVLMDWIAKDYPISKFPHFLFSQSNKESFRRENSAVITAFLFLQNKGDKIKRMDTHGVEKNILEHEDTLSIISAFLIVSASGCEQADFADYKNHLTYLRNGLRSHGMDDTTLLSKAMVSQNAMTINTVAQLLRDLSAFHERFGFTLFQTPRRWYHLDEQAFIKCLYFFLCGGKKLANTVEGGGVKVVGIKFANDMIRKQPLRLVELLANFKANCYNYAFTIDKLHNLQLYCILAAMIVDALSDAEIAKVEVANCYKFFVSDTICFMLDLLKTTHIMEVQQIALIFLKHEMLAKPGMCTQLGNDVVKSYLNDICKTLVHCAQITKCADVRQFAVETITSILTERQEQLGDAYNLLDEFPATDESFTHLRQLICNWQTKHSDDKQASTITNAFLARQQHSIAGLRTLQQYIAKNKSNMLLQLNDASHIELVKCLLAIVRDSGKTERSFDALKCLGEIGPVKFESISYYFQTDFELTEAQAMVSQPMEQFIGAMCQILDKHLLHFNAKSHKFLIAVASLVVNWQSSDRFIASFPNLQVFRVNTKKSNSSLFGNLNRIDWLKALMDTLQMHNYDSWICAFMSRIFESCGWCEFAQFASEQSSFADECLQPFVKLALADKEKQLDSLCAMLEYFFDRFAQTSDTSTSTTMTTTTNNQIFKEKRAVAKFLSICECVRIINDWNVPLKLINIIKASRYCQAYFMSVMYLELWANNEKNASNNFTFTTILNDADFQENAKQTYKAIGCIDAMSGFLNPLTSRLDYLNMENHWSDVLLEANVQEVSEMNNICTDILKRNGMLGLANMQQQNTDLIDYEIYWQLGQWDLPVDGHSKLNTLNDMEHEFKKHHYMALKSIYNREENNSLSALLNARKCVLVILREISVECLQGVYKYITWLKMLQQAEDFCKIQFATNTATTTAISADIFEKWQTELELEYGNFQCKDYLLSHQIALFKTGGIRANRKIHEFYKTNPTEQYLLNMLKDCKAAGEINLAKRNIAIIRAMPEVAMQTKVNMLLVDAEVCLISCKPQMAKAILQHISTDKTFQFCPQRVTALRMKGEQFMESNAENFETVLNKCFNASLELLENFEKNKPALMQKYPHCFDWHTFDAFKKTNRKSAYETIAKYANREYDQLNSYLNSEEYQTRLNIIKENRLAANSLGQTTDRDKKVGAMSMKSFANLDEKELKSLEDKRTDFLCTAIESYICFCQLDDDASCASDAIIYKIIALWLANEQNPVLQTKIEKLIPTVPSYKFICALNQLTARLNSKNADFLRVLTELLVRCVQDHPQHALYQLYPLIYGSHDSATCADSGNERVQVAKNIIKKGLNSMNMKCAKQLDVMFPALIEYANLAPGDNRKTKITLSQKLKNLQNLDAVQCPTLELNVSPNGQYNIISNIRWEEECTLVGGINVPKKLKCLCSDGKTRAQLLKGKDDLRQDAVMQQVFSLLNNLLKSQPKTAEKKLHLRTYKIAPLSMRSGILEWCENTIPIGVYLAGDGRSGAHKKYRPKDYTSHKCRQLSLEHLKKSTPAKRYEVYKHICENIKPVFHYFLLEKFLAPGVWFERRLAYTNSVAATSMVGFMLGLGDRHTQNILIDEKTAEVIHIDFGIAFDQGKIMPTAETVPFRLTRDMVAPMGVCETNGLFKKSCEMTMSLLRNNQSVITTVLEVLLYDPLYIWNVVPQQEAIGNQKAVERTNLTAKRALIAVQSKLNGQEPGMLGFSSVEVQIQRLINEATSARNLCLLYPGWDPYL